MKGIVFNIQRFSIHDGPGVRTTVFLKGCPMTCLWCHNPEGQSPHPQLIYRENRCRRCGDCSRACPAHALSLADGLVVINHEACTCCGQCADACATGAMEVAGKEMTAAEVIAQIERDRLFYDQSGGGVTFSGGEPLAQPEFVCALLRACREREIHTALDTTGYSSEVVLSQVSPLTSLFLFDIKLVDEQRHRRMTGVSNAPILRNLRLLAQAGCELVLRVPIIPGINDDEENIHGIGELAQSLGSGQRIDILPYHETAVEKYRRLQKRYELSATRLPSEEHMAEIAAIFERYGLTVHIGG